VLDAGHGVGASTPVASGTIRANRNAATWAAADTGSMNQRIRELLAPRSAKREGGLSYRHERPLPN
jgi:hypothetical protein